VVDDPLGEDESSSRLEFRGESRYWPLFSETLLPISILEYIFKMAKLTKILSGLPLAQYRQYSSRAWDR
jgi:hypothetical protein